MEREAMQVKKSPNTRRLLAAGVLTVVLTAFLSTLFLLLDSWDRTDECGEAIAEHGDLLMKEAKNVAGAQGTPEVSCDDTGGPPAYAVFDLQSGLEHGFDEILARQRMGVLGDH
jgi:hypothetical protein